MYCINVASACFVIKVVRINASLLKLVVALALAGSTIPEMSSNAEVILRADALALNRIPILRLPAETYHIARLLALTCLIVEHKWWAALDSAVASA